MFLILVFVIVACFMFVAVYFVIIAPPSNNMGDLSSVDLSVLLCFSKKFYTSEEALLIWLLASVSHKDTAIKVMATFSANKNMKHTL